MVEHIASTQLGIPNPSWDLMHNPALIEPHCGTQQEGSFRHSEHNTLAPSTAGGPTEGQGSKGSQTVLTIQSVYIRTAIATSA